jgi:hypothetical protein
MSFIKQALSWNYYDDWLAVANDLVGLLAVLRRELNKTHGDMVVVDAADATYAAQRTDRNILCAADCTVTLPPAADVKEQLFTVFCSAGTVTAEGLAVPIGGSLELLSDGDSYWPK